MTFSICVRETAPEGSLDRRRFGVAAAGRLPAVGSLCPHASAAGAVATQGVTDGEAGARCLDAVSEGVGVDAAVRTVLSGRRVADRRQIHGVDADGTAVHTGPECPGWAGHVEGEAHTVAGTALAGADVLAAVEGAYVDGERDAPLARRLVAALAAGQRAGGDRRDLPVGSAAVVVARDGGEARGGRDGANAGTPPRPLSDDLRVDAADDPVAALRGTYRAARRGYEAALARYQTAKE